jgi:nucleotide-binding universal stress UspA family protein
MAAEPRPGVERTRHERRFLRLVVPPAKPPVPPSVRMRRRRARSYRRIVVCLSPTDASARAVDLACSLTAEKHARLTAIAAVEIPLELPLEPVDETAARDAVHTAQAIGQTYGVSVEGVVLHTHDAAEAILAEVEERDTELVVVAATWPRPGRRGRLIGHTTDHILASAHCRVMLIGNGRTAAADPVFAAGRPSDAWPTGAFVDRVTPTR